MCRSMGRTSTFPLIDRAIGGGLRDFIADRRAAGTSLEQIARQLDAEHDVSVATETIRRWCIEQGIEPSTGEAA